MNTPLLEVAGVCAGYGAATDAIADVSLTLGAGQAVGVLGANGAGKSTLLKVLGGLLPARRGQVRLDDAVLPREGAAQRMRRGVVLLPEGHRVLRSLTVEENLRLAAISYWPRRTRSHLRSVLPEVYDLFPVLAERRDQLAGFLSGGEQQMLSLGRALVARPRVLLLDEPSLGLAPVVIERIYDALRQLRSDEISILVVEQNADRLSGLCDEVHVLQLGRVVASMRGDQVDQDVLRAAYFGTVPPAAPIPGAVS